MIQHGMEQRCGVVTEAPHPTQSTLFHVSFLESAERTYAALLLQQSMSLHDASCHGGRSQVCPAVLRLQAGGDFCASPASLHKPCSTLQQLPQSGVSCRLCRRCHRTVIN